MNCAVEGCQGIPHPHSCPGDGAYHRHGGIHFAPGSPLETVGFGWICNEHFAQAREEWGTDHAEYLRAEQERRNNF